MNTGNHYYRPHMLRVRSVGVVSDQNDIGDIDYDESEQASFSDLQLYDPKRAVRISNRARRPLPDKSACRLAY